MMAGDWRSQGVGGRDGGIAEVAVYMTRLIYTLGYMILLFVIYHAFASLVPLSTGFNHP
jgi:hypothetical protein